MSQSELQITSDDLNDAEFKIVQNILDHPSYLPTLEELHWMTDIEKDRLQTNILSLKRDNIVETHSITSIEDNTLPDEVTIYALTEEAINRINDSNMFNDLGLTRSLYKKAVKNTDRPEIVEKLASLERPEKESPDTIHNTGSSFHKGVDRNAK